MQTDDWIQQFSKLLKEITYLNRSVILCDWEIKTGCPKNAVDGLTDTENYLLTKLHEIKTSDETGRLLRKLQSGEYKDKLTKTDHKTIERLLKDYEEQKRIPADFYGEYVALRNRSQQVWEKAKEDRDYDSFEPYLSKMIDLTRRLCEYTNPEEEPYEVLLNKYEKGVSTKMLDRLFGEMKTGLDGIISKAGNISWPEKEKFLGDYPIDKQMELSKRLLEYIGFDLTKGEIAQSAHPFTTALSRNDVRLTNHYVKEDIVDAIFSIIHEGGHGIFEQNVDEKYEFTPFYSCEYMGIHESQSRFYENMLGRNINFWKPIFDWLLELFPEYRNISLQEFYRHINRIQCGPVRIQADDVTYGYHIIIRYELEKELFVGRLDTKQLPDRWKELYQKYLGVTPENDSEGVLQDTHWSGGDFGYFPTYLLGTIYDGMLLTAMEKELGDVNNILANGQIQHITAWLNEKIHQHGGARTPAQMMEAVVKRPVTAEDILLHFEKKLIDLR